MVDLPGIPNTLPELRAPQSRVSPGQIASPYQELAANLDRAGEVLSKDVAVPAAQRAGVESVTLDKDGQPVVQQQPLIIGEAGAAFARAARTTALAKAEPAIEEAATRIRLAHPADPEMVRRAGDEYVKDMVGRQSDPLLKSALELAGNRAMAANVRTAIVQADAVNTREFVASAESRLTAANDKAIALARQPGGISTPEYAQTVADRAAIYRELVADPRARYPQSRADQEIREQSDYEKGQAVIGHVVDLYKTKGNAAEARKALMDWAWGPGSEKLSLSEQKRNHIVAEGVSALERATAEDTVELKDFRASVSSYIAGVMKAPGTFNDIAHNGWVSKAVALGDAKTAADLQALRIVQPLVDGIKRLPTDQQVTALKQLEKGVIPNVGQGEMDLSGAAVNNLKTATEALKLTPQEQNLYKHHLDNLYGPGKVTNGSISTVRNITVEHDGRVVNIPTVWDGKILSNEEAIDRAAKEGWDKWPSYPSENAAFERYKTIHKSMDLDTRAYTAGRSTTGLTPGSSVFDQSAPVMRLFEQATKDMREHVGGEVGHMATRMTTDLLAGKRVTDQEYATFAAAVQSTGRYDLVQPVVAAAQASDAARGLEGGDPGAMAAQFRALAAGGQDPLKRKLYDTAADIVVKSAAAMQENPLVEGGIRQWTKPPRPLAVNDANAAAQELVQRQQSLNTIRTMDQSVGPHSAVLKEEIPGITQALTQGPVDQATQLLRAFDVLDPETRQATMASLADGLKGMARSYDPARMNAGMSELDQQWRSHPDTFEQTYKGDTLKRLQTWQAWKDSSSAADIVERFKRADDPSFAAARKNLEEEADKELKKWKPDDVAYAMGTSWGIPILSRMANVVTGATPNIPADGIQAGVLKAEFDQLYTDLRRNGIDADKAAEQASKRLRVKWGASPLNGNQLMPFPPERHYPEVHGSHDWMKQPLEEAIAKAVNQPRLSFKPSEVGGHATENWTYRIMSDAITEADIAAGRPPSYQIFVKKAATGLEEIPLDPSGAPMRGRWDASPAIAADQRRLDENQAAIEALSGKKMRGGFALQRAGEEF